MGSDAEGRRREAMAGFHCDVDAAISVVDGKWKLNIVWLLLGARGASTRSGARSPTSRRRC